MGMCGFQGVACLDFHAGMSSCVALESQQRDSCMTCNAANITAAATAVQRHAANGDHRFRASGVL